MARLNYVKSFRGTTKTNDGNLACNACRKPITPGMPYQWWANRSPGSMGGRKNIRCMDCTPSIAERTPGRRGQWMMMEIEFENTIGAISTYNELESVASEIADQIRDFGQEYVDGAENMEDGFGHETSISAELREKGEAIQEVADSLEQLSFDEFEPPEPEDREPDYDLEDASVEHLNEQRNLITECLYEVDV